MKRLIISFLYLLVTFQMCFCESFANPQEEIRNYLRQRVKQSNTNIVAVELDVSWHCLDNFIKESSRSNSPKIVTNFQRKFPAIYQQFNFPISNQLAELNQIVLALPQNLSQMQLAKPVITYTHLPNLSSQNSLVVLAPDQGLIPVRPIFSDNVYVRTGTHTFLMLHPLSLPSLSLNEIYKREIGGQLIFENIGRGVSPFELRLYGPDEQERFGWVAKGNYPIECFARAIPSKEKRKALPLEYGNEKGEDRVSHDGSHGVDSIHAPYPQALYNSNNDSIHISPLNPALNQQVRRSLTQLMGNSSYREKYLFDNNPESLPVRRKLAPYRWSKFEDNERAPIPSGTIFIGFDSAVAKVYFFPENRSGSVLSIYETLYEQAKLLKRKPTYKEDVIPQFEIQNAAHFFSPLIYDLNQTLIERKIQFYQTFFKAINLFQFASLNETVSFLKKLKVPFSWNGTRGLTSEQIMRVVHAAHQKNLKEIDQRETKVENRTPITYTAWNNFRFPVAIDDKKIGWVDAKNTDIPIFTKILPNNEIARFLNYVSRNLLEEAVKSPLATKKTRLGITEKYIQDGEFEKSANLLELIHPQIAREGKISECLWLFELYVDYFHKVPNSLNPHKNNYIPFMSSLIAQKRANTTVEEMLKIKLFNEKMHGSISPLEDGLAHVKTISPTNSSIIKKQLILPSKVHRLRKIINSVNAIEEFSLQNAIFCTTDYWVTVAETEDDTIEDHVSPSEYFWEYEKPLYAVLQSLAKHSNSLKKLNLRNVSFGFLSEEINRLSYWSDAGNILKTLRAVSFPLLEELHLTGIIKPSNEEALSFLERLKNHFPNLQKVFVSPEVQYEEFEIEVSKLPPLARIFRNAAQEEKDIDPF